MESFRRLEQDEVRKLREQRVAAEPGVSVGLYAPACPTRKRAAPMVSRLLRSAVAAAGEQADVEPGDLTVSAAWVDTGPMRKTWWARPKGMLARKLARSCHINLLVVARTDKEDTAEKGEA
jgi:ribosomal protein L22